VVGTANGAIKRFDYDAASNVWVQRGNTVDTGFGTGLTGVASSSRAQSFVAGGPLNAVIYECLRRVFTPQARERTLSYRNVATVFIGIFKRYLRQDTRCSSTVRQCGQKIWRSKRSMYGGRGDAARCRKQRVAKGNQGAAFAGRVVRRRVERRRPRRAGISTPAPIDAAAATRSGPVSTYCTQLTLDMVAHSFSVDCMPKRVLMKP
jgi:hypothetical protein